MHNNWKEMSSCEKKMYIVSHGFVVLGLVFAILDVCNVWAYAHLCWCISFAIYLGIEAKMSLAKNRNLSIIQIVCAVVLLGLSILELVK